MQEEEVCPGIYGTDRLVLLSLVDARENSLFKLTFDVRKF